MGKIKQIEGLQTALDNKLTKNTPITGATNTKITYDDNGLVTAGAALAAGDIPALDAGKITSGTFDINRIPAITVAKGGTGLTTLTSGSFLQGNGTGSVNLRTGAQVKSDIGLANVTNDAQVKKAASSTNGSIPKWSGTAGDTIVDGYTVQTTVRATGSATDTAMPTEKAVRDAITGALSAADAMKYMGVIDCAANPNYPAANAGDTYKVGTAGKIGGASGVNVLTGDIVICKVDSTESGNHATVGANWDIISINREGEVIGPANVTADGNIALFDGTTGKVIKDSTVKISDIQAGATRQAKQKITGQSGAANTEVTMVGALTATPLSGTEPMLFINGINYERGTYASLGTDEWGFSGTTLKVKLSFALETTDKIVVVYNY